MTKRHLLFRNLAYYWRTNLAVIAGVATAVAVLSGALLVGRSVQDSLRSLLYQRLGATEFVVAADRFFRENLFEAFAGSDQPTGAAASCPIIFLQGILINPDTDTRVHNVNVYGVDRRFWNFHAAAVPRESDDRMALVGLPLAEKLGLKKGDPLLIRIETQQGIPRESLYGRKDNLGRTIRLRCGDLLPSEELGEFSLRPDQGNIYSVFVPLERLQKDLQQPSRTNVVLFASKSRGIDLQDIRDWLRDRFTLEDVGLRLMQLPSRSVISIESTRIILDESIAKAVTSAAAQEGLPISGLYTYLANSIRVADHEIPYSAISAADLGLGALTSIRPTRRYLSQPEHANGDSEIWLTDWAWQDLRPNPGDPVEIEYYVWQEDGRLATRTASFRLAGVIPIGGDVDASLTPDFPGISEARTISAWDPPFPVDLKRIRPVDEEYWDRYKATPKAFISLAEGQHLWQSRFGNLTALRIALPQTQDPTSILKSLAGQVRSRIIPESVGFSVSAVRESGLEASRGSTDFGEYFIYFSFFLIVAAILFSALFFKLGVEQRVREVGTLRALGFSMTDMRRVFLQEGLILSVVGSLIGVLGALGYGELLMVGLRTWWVGAVGTNRLQLYIAPGELAVGAAAGIAVSLAVTAWTVRGLKRSSPRSLLAGVLESAVVRRRRSRVQGLIALVAFSLAAVLLGGSAYGIIPDVGGFFGAGLLLLIGMVSMTAIYLRREKPRPISGNGWRAFFRLGARNTTYRPQRSLLCIVLIGSATFIIVSVEAFRRDPTSVSMERTSGTGGYALIAESSLPIVYDPNNADGREALGIPDSEFPSLAEVKFVPFRLRAGDDASCLNLYAPREPKILGASHSFIASGRFSFADSLASSPEEKENPWLLLESEPGDGSIPAIGDANTIQYILHLALGRELALRGGDGTPVRLRLVASLRDSTLQGELIISESNFLRFFPEQEGYRFFLLDAPLDREAYFAQLLMKGLEDFGFAAESSSERLAAYHRVENTYLSTFQSLGALGLILGTAGLATLLLRNVLERRKELALLRAVGYRRGILSGIIVAENIVLLACGLSFGTVSALIAIIPAIHARGTPLPVVMIALVLLAVLAVGLASSLLAVIAAIRSPLLDTLRSE